MITVEEAKTYLRIEHDYEDMFIALCTVAADAYIKNAVTDYDEHEQDENFTAQVKLVEMQLVSEMYTNRDARNDSRREYSYTVRAMITQLQLWGREE